MTIRRFLQSGAAGLVLGGMASAAEPDTVRLGRTETQAGGITHEALKDDDTELVHGRRGGWGGYYGGFGIGVTTGYGGWGYGGWGYGYGFGFARYYGGWGYGYSTFYTPRIYSYPVYYAPPYFYAAPACFYGIGGQTAPATNLGGTKPTTAPSQAPTPLPAPAPLPKTEPVETLKVNLPAKTAGVAFPAFGDE
jgi:hypothetical protein